jgi:hypothetical protein
MPRYLVESYAANRPERFDDVHERARLAAELGSNVEHVRTTFVPHDEVVLHIFDARSEETLRDAVGRAGLDHERIVEAVEPPADSMRKARAARTNGGLGRLKQGGLQ